MSNRLVVATFALCALVATACTPLSLTTTNPGPTSTSSVRVTAVVDGDTLDVALASGIKQRVRILGIDAPEIAHEADRTDAQCGADAARAALTRRTLGKDVVLVDDAHTAPIDRYGRRLAYVQVSGVDAGHELLSAGLAGAWKPAAAAAPERWSQYRHAADVARHERRGSWATCPYVGRTTA